MEQIKHKSLPFEKTIDSKKLLGEKVFTKSNKKLGNVRSIHLDPKDLTVEGIMVDTGFFEMDQYIGKNYIRSLSEKGVFLKIDPVTQYIGLEVFDSQGIKVGKVKDVTRSKQTNNLISITVEGKMVGGQLMFTSDYIAAVGESIMLKEKVAKT